MPVHESARRVRLPRPDMQRVERRQTEAVRTFEEVQQLAHSSGVPALVACQASENTRKSAPIKRRPPFGQRLINHDLGPTWIQHAIAHQRHVDVVQTHRAVVRPAHAAEQQLIPIRLRLVDVAIPPSGFAHYLDQVAGVLLVLFGLLAIARISTAGRAGGSQGENGRSQTDSQTFDAHDRGTPVAECCRRRATTAEGGVRGPQEEVRKSYRFIKEARRRGGGPRNARTAASRA